MKNLALIVSALIIMIGSVHSQSLASFEDASKNSLSFSWTKVNPSKSSEMMIVEGDTVLFVSEMAQMAHQTEIENHISKESPYSSSYGEIIKGVLRDIDDEIIGSARLSFVGTSIAGHAIIGNDEFKFAPNSEGIYSWEKQQEFKCGTEESHHVHGPECHHHEEVSSHSGSQTRDPNSCTTESIQDVAFVTDDLMSLYGDDLDAILAQMAIDNSWAEDVMENSGFSGVQFFQELVVVVDFDESGSTVGNMQLFSDELYGSGIIAGVMQDATTSVAVLYSAGGGVASGAAIVSSIPITEGYYRLVLGNNSGIGSTTKIHEFGHALWGGMHEDTTPDPVIYRRAYEGVNADWGAFVTIMGRGDFPGVRIPMFSTSDPNASYYYAGFETTFGPPLGDDTRKMRERIIEEWGRLGIVQVVDLTPATPVISADGSVTFCDGESVTLSVDSPEAGVDYIWSNGTTANNITVTTSGNYSCYGQSSSTCTGETSNTIIVVVNPVVEITGNPSDQDVFTGESFTLTAGGNNVDTYQWYKNNAVIVGATSATYSVSSASASDAGSYDCELSNSCGSVNTEVATVTVEDYSLEIDPSSMTVSASSGNTAFAVISNESWTITTSHSYVIPSPSSGNGYSAIAISYPSINTMAGETYTATIESGSGIIRTFTINQNGVDPYLTLSDDSETVGAEAGTHSIEISCPDDMSWSGTAGDFSSPSPSSGTGPGTVVINYDANTSEDERVDILTFSGNGESADFTLTQVGTGADLAVVIEVNKPHHTVEESPEITISAAGGTGNYNYSGTVEPGGYTFDGTDFSFQAMDAGHYVASVTVTDGENSATESVEFDVHVVSVELVANPQSAHVGEMIDFTVTIVLESNDPRTIDEIYIEFGDGTYESGYSNPSLFEKSYGTSDAFDVEITAFFADGSTLNVTFIGFIEITVGITPIEDVDIEIYPIPTANNLFINTQERLERVSIINLLGSEVFHQEGFITQEVTQLDLSSLSRGTYLVRVHFMNGTIVIQKIIKQ